MPDYAPIGDVDKIGVMVAGGMLAGIAGHAAVSVVQKMKRDAIAEQEEAEKKAFEERRDG